MTVKLTNEDIACFNRIRQEANEMAARKKEFDKWYSAASAKNEAADYGFYASLAARIGVTLPWGHRPAINLESGEIDFSVTEDIRNADDADDSGKAS